MAHLLDLSHTIEAGMVTYPGLPGPVISDHLSRVDSRANYAPRFEGQSDLAGLALDDVADLPGLCVEAPGPDIGLEAVGDAELAGKAVLFATGWDRHWGTDTYGDPSHPFVNADLVARLIDGGAVLVGIDSVNIDDTRGGERPAHSGLLAAGIQVVEHLTGLSDLVGREFRFFAVPPKVSGFGTFPVRAFAIT
jgi:kynurenine formamidase